MTDDDDYTLKIPRVLFVCGKDYAYLGHEVGIYWGRKPIEERVEGSSVYRHGFSVRWQRPLIRISWPRFERF